MTVLKDTSGLIERLNNRETAAFEELFHTYNKTLCFFAAKIIRDNDAARDVVQDIFIKFWEKGIRFEHIGAVKTFLFNSVQHLALNYLEKRNNRNRIQKKMEIPVVAEEQLFLWQVEADVYARLRAAIDQLPDQCRRIFILSYIDQKEIKEIAHLLNIAETTVKTQRRRAKAFLRGHLRQEDLVLFYFFKYKFRGAWLDTP